MRKLTTALLALPVVSLVYLAEGTRRSPLPRVVVVLAAAAALVLAAGAVRPPAGTSALPPATTAPLLDPAMATRIETGESPTAAITLAFPVPMDQTSVADLVEVDPPAPVTIQWDAGGTVLTVRPMDVWQPGVLHTITIDAGALDGTGRPMASVVRAVFLTQPATRAVIEATQVIGGVAALGSAFTVDFDRPINDATLAISVDPKVDGILEPAAPRDGFAASYRFTPSGPLAAETSYTVTLPATVLDSAGAPVDPGSPLVVRTGARPSVVRFRPADTSTEAALTATLSVRFTEAMDEGTTSAAWHVTAGGSPVSGKISFAEGDTVLVFEPAAAFTYGQTVAMTVDAGARSQAGVALAGDVSGTFTTMTKKATPTPAPATAGGSVGAGAWAGVEAYYLTLMNCTRTGGWVQSNGSCVGGGSGSTAPLWVDQGITSLVSRPYAKMEAETGQCSHFINGTPGDRLAAAGYKSYTWAENLGCQDGVDPNWSMLSTQLYFQNEKSTNGGHYVNLMNPKYDRCGLAVWVASGRVRLVVDFYHP